MAVEIILDAGHGGFDKGATYKELVEKDQVLQLTLDVGRRLEALGYVVKYIRTTDIYESPYQKAEKANELGGDYFLSFHRNYAVEDNLYHGVQSLVYDLENEKDIAMATTLNQQLELVGFQDLGVEEVKDLIVLRETDMPAVLLEVGFINSEIDNALWKNRYPEIVDAIVSAIQIVAPLPKEAPVGRRAVSAVALSPGYYVQTGVFKHDINAAYQLERLHMLGYDGMIYYEKPYYGVWIGPMKDLEESVVLQNKLRKDGYRTFIVSDGMEEIIT